jgi:hypothetical protein
LRQDFFERNGNGQGAGIRVQEPGLQFQRQCAEDWLQRQLDPPAVLMNAILVRRCGFGTGSHNDPPHGRRGSTGRGHGLVFVGRLNPLSQKIL